MERGAEGAQVRRPGEERVEHARAGGALQEPFQHFDSRSVIPPEPARVEQDRPAARDGLVRRTNDNVVSSGQGDGRIEHELGPTLRPTAQHFSIKEPHPGLGFSRRAEGGHF